MLKEIALCSVLCHNGMLLAKRHVGFQPICTDHSNAAFQIRS